MRSIYRLASAASFAAACIAVPAQAAVITSLPGGTALTVPNVNLQGVSGPIAFGPGVTFTTSSSTARFGWTSALQQYLAFPWLGTPAIGLNTAEATFTLTFDNPIKAFLGQMTWGTAGYSGFASRVSAYDTIGEQLDNIDFVIGGVNQLPRRSTYGFSYAAPEIKRIVFTNDFIAVRNMSIISGAIPEPETWAMMLLGFAVVGVSARRRNRPMVLA